ncbi:peptidase E [Streptococcus criceti]|uniref:Peptidase, S51 family n=1 Tax=Streptococcus criceti HS-6 TaxID=873449 RepID=G5JPK0_STRCG|nr:Type 1 glutamine amidotransferase-like domain-containing protein [Streptococcus criceti]EHI74191.1 peptidase, S51 family [Streptococcus criceti HS-6]SUN41845.1 peptidase E [Streptococcus criceti]
MKFFLTSYIAGTEKQLKDFLKDYSSRILFIPTAGNVEEYTGYIDEGIKTLNNLGFTLDILNIAQESKKDCDFAIASCDCLCIAGGNTFYLLQELEKKSLVELITQRIREGMLYIGESAGAIITSKDIEYSRFLDNPSSATALKDYTGLNLWNKYLLPHNNEFPFIESTAETIQTYSKKLDLLPIDNQTAVVIENEQFSVIG